MTREQNFVPETLADFNKALTNLSLISVTKERLNEILVTEPKERLIKAINQAANDSRALAYLNRFFGASVQGDTGSLRPQPANNNQPPRAEERSPAAPANSAPRTSENEEATGNKDRQFSKKHVYGGKAALCFEADETRGGINTVCLDAADATAPRQYDWANKIRVQFTRDELLVVSAVFFGMIPRCEYKNHGEDNSKGFSVEDQGDKLFVRVFAKGHNIKAVPVPPEDAFYVAQLLLGQMKGNAPHLNANEILMTLQRVVASRKTPNKAA